MDNQQVTVFELGWLVGFLEGEGSFILQKQAYKKQVPTFRPQVFASSTDFELAERMGRILDSMNVGKLFQRRRLGNRGYKDQLCINVFGIKRCKKLLDLIIPYMTDSRRKVAASTLLEFCNLRLSKPHQAPYEEGEFALRENLCLLNRSKSQNLRDLTQNASDNEVKVKSSLVGNA
jgi:hypothetical protein